MVVGDTRSGAETPTFSPSKMVFTVQTHVTEPFNMEAISRKAEVKRAVKSEAVALALKKKLTDAIKAIEQMEKDPAALR